MLREVPNGVSSSWWGLVLKVREAKDGELIIPKKYLDQAKTTPIRIFDDETAMPDYWLYQGRLYRASESLESEDFLALLAEKQVRARRRIERAKAVVASASQPAPSPQRQPIPIDVKTAVWQRDAGRCTECGSNKSLEFDHIIPLAMGGANTFRNLQLLCADCNRRKGPSLG